MKSRKAMYTVFKVHRGMPIDSAILVLKANTILDALRIAKENSNDEYECFIFDGVKAYW